MCFGKVRFQLQRSAVGGDRLVELPLALASVSQIAVKREFGRVQFNRPTDVLNGRMVVSLLRGNHSQQVPRINLFGVSRQNLPIDLLGSLKAPVLMVLNG